MIKGFKGIDPWLISDTHFGHQKIIEYCNRPEDHEQIIQENWRRLVGEDDLIIHLGDVAFGSKTNLEVVKALPGKKILIMGNHDYRFTPGRLRDSGFYDIFEEIMVSYCDIQFHLTHKPLPRKKIVGDVNVHGHTHLKCSPYPWHYNVSVEQTSLGPIKLSDIYNHQKNLDPDAGILYHPETEKEFGGI